MNEMMNEMNEMIVRPVDRHQLHPDRCTWCWPIRLWKIRRRGTWGPVPGHQSCTFGWPRRYGRRPTDTRFCSWRCGCWVLRSRRSCLWTTARPRYRRWWRTCNRSARCCRWASAMREASERPTWVPALGWWPAEGEEIAVAGTPVHKSAQSW